MSSIGRRHRAFVDNLARLLTTDDTAKIGLFEALIREQIASYGISTFPASELQISEESYRPQKEGFEIGFELSASDAIRLKWAYQLALLETARTHETNHPGFVVLMSHGSRNQLESGSDAFWNARRRQRLRFDFYCLGSAATF